jgi:hypothetical protein
MESTDHDASEWRALLKLCRATVPWALGAVWAWSLQIVPVMALAFDSDVSRREGIRLGLIEAAWVAGIPVALLFLSHLIHNGFRAPRWRLRWILVAICAVLSVLIFDWWISATPDSASY